MLKFSIPGYFSKYKYIFHFLDYYFNNPQFFYKDRTIDSLYDSPTGLIWNGGRMPNCDGVENNQFMGMILNELENYPTVKLRHTFTNCLITQELTYDYMCNHFVKTCIRPQDSVILNSQALIDYFNKTYPNIPIIYSTTLGITDIDTVNELTKNNIYVMNYNYNYDDTYIDQLKYPENIEVLGGEPCVPNCLHRQAHYLQMSKSILHINDSNGIYSCFYNTDTYDEFIKREIASLTNERIEQLTKKGIQYFKISGRGNNAPAWIDIILYYLTLPQYKDQVFKELIYRFW